MVSFESVGPVSPSSHREGCRPRTFATEREEVYERLEVRDRRRFVEADR